MDGGGLGTGFVSNRAPALGFDLLRFAPGGGWRSRGLGTDSGRCALCEGGFAHDSDRVMIRILIGSLAR